MLHRTHTGLRERVLLMCRRLCTGSTLECGHQQHQTTSRQSQKGQRPPQSTPGCPSAAPSSRASCSHCMPSSTGGVPEEAINQKMSTPGASTLLSDDHRHSAGWMGGCQLRPCTRRAVAHEGAQLRGPQLWLSTYRCGSATDFILVVVQLQVLCTWLQQNRVVLCINGPAVLHAFVGCVEQAHVPHFIHIAWGRATSCVLPNEYKTHPGIASGGRN